MEEGELVKKCQRGERKGQELLYARYADKMFRVGFRYIKTAVDTEDVLIVAFNKIFAAMNSFHFKGEGSLEAWLRKVVVNECLMWLRKRHNFNLTETIDENIAEADLSVFSKASAEDIYRMITELPVGYRTVFNLSVVEGFDHHEIAKQLAISEGTSRSQLSKAKSLLRKMLTREGYQYGT